LKRPRMMTLVRVYGLASSLVLSGFMAWFFYTLDNGSVWLVSPDEWNGFETFLSLLSCITITIMMLDYVRNTINQRRASKWLRGKILDMKVSKVLETEQYGNIYSVDLPIRFFFNKDGSYDGIEVHVENTSDRDQELVKELCEKLTQTLPSSEKYEPS